jgi:hypothetical protein
LETNLIAVLDLNFFEFLNLLYLYREFFVGYDFKKFTYQPFAISEPLPGVAMAVARKVKNLGLNVI